MRDSNKVDFSTYCPRCVHIDKDPLKQPCNSCLRIFTANSETPVYFTEKENKNMIKKLGKVLNLKEEIEEKLDWLFTGYNQMRKVINDDRDSIKDLYRNIESHEGRLDGIDERLELICMRIGDYERERAEGISKEAKEVDICESEPKDLHTSDASESELRIRDLERELELIKNNQEVYNLGYQAGYEQGCQDAY